MPYKVIVVLSFKEQLCYKCKLRQITCLLTFKNCPKADIFFPNKILVRSDYQIKNKMICPSVQAMTRVWEKSHDVSFNKQVALEDAHRQAGPVTGQPGPVSGLPGLTGPVQCSMQRSLPIQRALFCRFDNF